MLASAPRPASPSTTRRRLTWLAVRLLFAVNIALVALLWLAHGGADHFSSPSGALIAIGQLSALLGSYLALVGLVLVARTPRLERLFGDRGARYHRILGVSSIGLIVLHVACTVGGYALVDAVPFLDEFSNEVITYPYMLAALVGFGLFLVVGVTSMPLIRRHLSHETWSGIHLYAYLAIVLALGHQLAVGSDFAAETIARVYWLGLYTFVFGLIVRYRVLAPILMLARHRFRVERVVLETSDTVSIYVGGRHLDRIPAQAGQYFRLRLIARNEWWRSHPFSISAVPDGHSFRFTVKALGDFSERLQSLGLGTRVMLEGPYGALTSNLQTTRRVALIGGGIGVTPIRALFEELAGKVDVKLIYRASRAEDLVFWDELWRLERRPKAAILWLVGKRGSPSMPEDPLNAEALSQLVPDIKTRDIFVCGPARMMDAVERSLRELGVPPARIHSERFAA
jgi:predicted ferric reductase